MEQGIWHHVSMYLLIFTERVNRFSWLKNNYIFKTREISIILECWMDITYTNWITLYCINKMLKVSTWIRVYVCTGRYLKTADVGRMRFWCWKLPEKWLTPNEQQMVITAGDILFIIPASDWSVFHNTGFWLVICTLILTLIGWADIFIIIIPLETSPTASWWPHGFIFGASVFVTRWWGRQMVRVRVKFMTTWRIIPLYSPCCAGLTHVCTNNLFNLSHELPS